jgi:hypothetical protein
MFLRKHEFAVPTISFCYLNDVISVIILACVGTLKEGFIQYTFHFTHMLLPEEYFCRVLGDGIQCFLMRS